MISEVEVFLSGRMLNSKIRHRRADPVILIRTGHSFRSRPIILIACLGPDALVRARFGCKIKNGPRRLKRCNMGAHSLRVRW